MSKRPIEVDIQIHGAVPKEWPETRAKKIVRAVLDELKVDVAEIGIALLTTAKMSAMNKAYHGTDGATDVLSFGYGETRKTGRVDGDILICPAFARAQARTRKIDIAEEMSRLLIHGLLHLSGMDHANARTEKAMFSLQEGLLKKI